MGNKPVVNVDAEIVYGEITLADDTTSSFGGAINVATELTTISSPYHVHDAELSVLNKEATCTEAGYANRTYCATCGSVVDFGTIIEALGHNYVVVGDQLVCDKDGVVLNANGLVNIGDKIYCLINGKLVTGWQNVDGKHVYVNASTKEVKVGTVTVSGITYNTDENGFVYPAWVINSTGRRLSYGPKFYTREWVEFEGAKYYFGTDSYVYTGIRYIVVNRNNVKEGYRVYNFAADGKLLDDMLTATGIFKSDVEGMYYVENGKTAYGGLMFVDGAYYYARSSGQILTNTTYWITKTNDLLPAANYIFDADGKITNVPMNPTLTNGIISENGKLWWYFNDVKTYGGLMLIDGEYYYARTSGEILTNTTYWISKTNDLLPAGQYTFGADGKMIDAPSTESGKNGIISEDGKLWWYVDGVKTYGGLMLIDGEYYYARTSGEILTNKTYWVTKTNDLLPANNYTFGADGKMVK